MPFGFLKRKAKEAFGSAREAQKQEKGITSETNAAQEAAERGAEIRERAVDAVKDAKEAAKQRVGSFLNRLGGVARSVRSGISKNFDRALGTPGLLIDTAAAGKQAVHETAQAGAQQAERIALETAEGVADAVTEMAGIAEGGINTAKKEGGDLLAGIAEGVDEAGTEINQLVRGGISTAVEQGGQALMDLANATEIFGNQIDASVRGKAKELRTETENTIVDLEDALFEELSPELQAKVKSGDIPADTLEQITLLLVDEKIDLASKKGKEAVAMIEDALTATVEGSALLVKTGLKKGADAMATMKNGWNRRVDHVLTRGQQIRETVKNGMLNTLEEAGGLVEDVVKGTAEEVEKGAQDLEKMARESAVGRFIGKIRQAIEAPSQIASLQKQLEQARTQVSESDARMQRMERNFSLREEQLKIETTPKGAVIIRQVRGS